LTLFLGIFCIMHRWSSHACRQTGEQMEERMQLSPFKIIHPAGQSIAIRTKEQTTKKVLLHAHSFRHTSRGHAAAPMPTFGFKPVRRVLPEHMHHKTAEGAEVPPRALCTTTQVFSSPLPSFLSLSLSLSPFSLLALLFRAPSVPLEHMSGGRTSTDMTSLWKLK